jgi:multiple sugar transport system substrate-binding protein
MRRLLIAALAIFGMAVSVAQAEEKITFWYHFDNPENPIKDLVAKFEAQNPGIKVDAQNIPWGSYYDQLFTSIIGGKAPDTAMVKLWALPQLIEMEALVPIDDRIAKWDAKADILPDLWDITKGPDGKHYYMPIQYVALYLYYRADVFKKAGLQPPKTCDEFLSAAKSLTKDGMYGFGLRGAKGGHDHFLSFALAMGASFEKGGMVTPEAINAAEWFVDLHRVHKIFPPSAPTDGFNEITGGFRAGRTAMTIHHIGSSASMIKALGDKVSAVPVPRCGGKGWTSFGDESTAVFSQSKSPDAAWKWISFLSTGDNNILFNQATGQMPVTKSGTASWNNHEKRFVDATAASLPIAGILPLVPETGEFVGSVWPTTMQRALLGEITPKQMMETFEKHYHK